MSHKAKNNAQEEAVDTGKVLTEDILNEQEPAEDASPEAQQQPAPEDKQMPKPDKSQEYLEMAQRVQAEFDNYRRRNLEIAQSSRQDGIVYSVEAILPILDTITSAKRQVKDDTLSKSIDLIYKQALDCLSKLGVTKIDAVGKPFDPNFHNAIMTEHQDGVKPDMVLDEFQEGFMIGNRVIRHSVVKVSK